MASKVRRTKVKKKLINVKLEKIIGNTSNQGNSLFWRPSSLDMCHVAGCCVTLTAEDGSQNNLLVGRSSRKVSCLTFSPDGKYLAVGETGRYPAILVWDVDRMNLINSLMGHEYGIKKICFEPEGTYILSLGIPHDGNIILWNWLNEENPMVLKKQVLCPDDSKVSDVTFSSDGSYFVTVGNMHVKHWYIAPLLEQATLSKRHHPKDSFQTNKKSMSSKGRNKEKDKEKDKEKVNLEDTEGYTAKLGPQHKKANFVQVVVSALPSNSGSESSKSASNTDTRNVEDTHQVLP